MGYIEYNRVRGTSIRNGEPPFTHHRASLQQDIANPVVTVTSDSVFALWATTVVTALVYVPTSHTDNQSSTAFNSIQFVTKATIPFLSLLEPKSDVAKKKLKLCAAAIAPGELAIPPGRQLGWPQD